MPISLATMIRATNEILNLLTSHIAKAQEAGRVLLTREGQPMTFKLVVDPTRQQDIQALLADSCRRLKHGAASAGFPRPHYALFMETYLLSAPKIS